MYGDKKKINYIFIQPPDIDHLFYENFLNLQEDKVKVDFVLWKPKYWPSSSTCVHDHSAETIVNGVKGEWEAIKIIQFFIINIILLLIGIDRST